MSGRALAHRTKLRANDVADEHVRQLAYDLRLAGYSYRAIAEKLPPNPSTGQQWHYATVYRWVLELLEAQRQEPREAIRLMELERLDAYMLSLEMQWAATKEPQYMALILRTQERRARLLGLDAPTVVDTSVTIQQTEDSELEAAVQAAREAAQRARGASQGTTAEQGVPGT